MSNSKYSLSPFEIAIQQEHVEPRLIPLLRSLYQQETGGGLKVKTSNQGAVGDMQIQPNTFKSVADKGWNIKDPVQNIRGGIRYVKQLDELAGGNLDAVAAGYYGGPKAIKAFERGEAYKDKKNPNAPDTIQYSHQVRSRMPPEEKQHKPLSFGPELQGLIGEKKEPELKEKMGFPVLIPGENFNKLLGLDEI